MGKINLTKKKRNLSIIIALVITLGLLGGAGLAIYKHQHSEKKQENSSDISNSPSLEATDTTTTNPPTTPTPSTNSYADWATYSDEYVSFRYPKSWVVSREYVFTDSYGALSINIKAPVDSSLVPADVNNKSLYLSSNIILAKDGRFSGDCSGCGQVFSVEPIKTGDGSSGNLIITDSGVQGEPAAIDLLGGQVVVGDVSYTPTGIRVGGNYNIRVLGGYNSGDISVVGFNNVDTIRNSQQYGLLKDLIKTIKVQSSNLPQ